MLLAVRPRGQFRSILVTFGLLYISLLLPRIQPPTPLASLVEDNPNKKKTIGHTKNHQKHTLTHVQPHVIYIFFSLKKNVNKRKKQVKSLKLSCVCVWNPAVDSRRVLTAANTFESLAFRG